MVNLRIDLYIILLTVLCCANLHKGLAQQRQESTDQPIKIGLLLPDFNSIEAKYGAELALAEANKKGGVYGRPIQLITRSMEGPWGSGSKEVVDLVFKEKIWAIMGSHDGRNAHLVEQVIAKTRVVFVSAQASDPTLSQAYVPWYFSVVPNDQQQAKVLIDELHAKRKHDRVAVVINKTYDAQMAWKSLLVEIKKAGMTQPEPFYYDETQENFNDIIHRIQDLKATAIILIGRPPRSWNFIDQLRLQSMDQPVFGTLSVLGESVFFERQLKAYDQIILIGSENWLSSKPLSFQKKFYNAYGKNPGAAAAYAYDGMKVLIKALEYAKLDREKMQESMFKIQVQGVTGTVRFDEKGRLANAPQLIEINGGNAVLLVK
jgi:branched-chain amino acid transport system substrate-binding protein